MRVPRNRLFLPLLAGAVGSGLAGVVLSRFTTPLFAEHLDLPGNYVGSILTASEDEEWCLLNHDSSVDPDDAIDKLSNTIFFDNQSGDWNLIGYRGGSWNIQFVRVTCDPEAEIEFLVRERGCGDAFPNIEDLQDRSCEYKDEPYFDPLRSHPEPVYDVSYIWLDDWDLNHRTHQVINHELGHSFGLADGGTENPRDPPDPNYIPTPCTGSLMHVYGCDNNADWPTAADRASVEGLMPAGSGSVTSWNFCCKVFV